jgi:hypothetical protein
MDFDDTDDYRGWANRRPTGLSVRGDLTDLSDTILKLRALKSLDIGARRFPIHRRVRFAARRPLENLFDDLAQRSGLAALRLDTAWLILDGPCSFVEARGNQKTDYCSGTFSMWADSSEAPCSSRAELHEPDARGDLQAYGQRLFPGISLVVCFPAMRLSSFEAIIAALNDAGVRYLVAGGLAVNAHGYLRFTHDVDLVIALLSENIFPAFAALTKLGYKPLVPIRVEQFADEQTRRRLIAEKGMTVLSLHSEEHREAPVDIFVEFPFDFDAEYRRSLIGEIGPGLHARFVSLETLIAMKDKAGRPRDLDDVHHLRWILEDRDRDG